MGKTRRRGRGCAGDGGRHVVALPSEEGGKVGVMVVRGVVGSESVGLMDCGMEPPGK